MQSVFAPTPASPTVRGSDGAIYAVSSFGVDGTTFGPDWRPQEVIQSQRRRALTFRRSFARCTQHDWKMFDSQGRFIHAGPIEYWQPLIGNSQPGYYVPLDQRRPAAPLRLAKIIVARFTALVFGHNRFPKVRCPGDSDTEDFVQALIKQQSLATVMIRARNVGGSTGSVGLSWRFCAGEARTRVHDPSSVYVHVWRDKERCIVEHVTEIQIVDREVFNPHKKRVEKQAQWVRRDWTPNADLVFCETPVTQDVPEWVLDVDESFIHNEGTAHFVWVQNLPPDEDGWHPDGNGDYEGSEEPMLTLDTLSSVLNTGTIRNLDPTLVLNLDPEVEKHTKSIQKGSDNALTVGLTGGVKYLELSGSATQTGIALRQEERKHVFEAASCIVADPDQIAAAGTSGIALELLFQPMLNQADLLRASYGAAMIQLLDQQLESARKHYPLVDTETGQVSYSIDVDTETEETIPVAETLAMPYREVEEEVLDVDGNPTGEKNIALVERHPGTSRALELEWPPYFPLSAQDQQAQGQALGMATGGRPVLSQQTGVELFAGLIGRDHIAEWKRISDEQRKHQEFEGSMFPGIGGEVSRQDELPDGAEAIPIEEPSPDASPLNLEVTSEQVLTGAQIAAAVEIVKAVVKKELPRDAGLGQLQVLFNLTPDQAKLIMGSAGQGFVAPAASQEQ